MPITYANVKSYLFPAIELLISAFFSGGLCVNPVRLTCSQKLTFAIEKICTTQTKKEIEFSGVRNKNEVTK